MATEMIAAKRRRRKGEKENPKITKNHVAPGPSGSLQTISNKIYDDVMVQYDVIFGVFVKKKKKDRVYYKRSNSY